MKNTSFRLQVVPLAAILLAILAPVMQAWGASYTSTITAAASPSAGGTVFVNTSKSDSGATYAATSSKSDTKSTREIFGMVLAHASFNYYLYAKPVSGYFFAGWAETSDGASVSSANPYTYSFQDESRTKTFYAKFEQDTAYELTLVKPDGVASYTVTGPTGFDGAGLSSGGTASVYKSGSYTFEVTVSDGYEFSKWTVNGADAGTSTTLTKSFSFDATVQAVVSKLETHYVTCLPPPAGCSYTVNETPVSDGEQVVSGYGKVSVTLSSSDSKFLNWKINNTTIVADNPYTLTCTENTTVSAEFLTDDQVTTVSTLADLTAALSNDAYKGITIPSGTEITVPSGTAVTVPAGKKVVVDGTLVVYGTLAIASGSKVVGDGTLVHNWKTISQAADVHVPFPLGTDGVEGTGNGVNTVDGTAGKYLVTSVVVSDNVTGSFSCATEKWFVTVENKASGQTYFSAPSTSKPVGVLCTVAREQALNWIVGVSETVYTDCEELLKGAMNPTGAAVSGNVHSFQDTNKLAVLTGNAGTVTISVTGTATSADIGSSIDLAGSSITIDAARGNKGNYQFNASRLFRAFNGNLTLNRKIMNVNFCLYNITGKVATMSGGYNGAVSLYDSPNCTVSWNEMKATTPAGGLNFYGGGPYNVTYQTTPTAKFNVVYWGTFNSAKNPTPYLYNDQVIYAEQDPAQNNIWVVKEIFIDPNAGQAMIGAQEYSLVEAFENASAGDVILLKKDVELDADIVSAASNVRIDLNGWKLSGSNAIINNGDLEIIDENGNGQIDVPIINNGTLLLSSAKYNGPITLNSGFCYFLRGTFGGGVTVASSVEDATSVAEIYGGSYSPLTYTHGEQSKNLVRLCKNGYVVNNAIAQIPVSYVTSSSFASYSLSAFTSAESSLYMRNATRSGYTRAEWIELNKLNASSEMFSRWGVDCAVAVDRTAVANDLSVAAMGFNNFSIDEEIPANGSYSALFQAMRRSGQATAPWTYGDILPGGAHSGSLSFSVSNKAAQNGTLCRVEMRLATGVRNMSGPQDWSYTEYVTTAERKLVLGAGTSNKAMIRPASGAATFYSTLGAAMNAAADGGTVMLANDCTDALPLTKEGTYTFDTMGFAYSGGEPTVGSGLKITSVTTNAVDSSAKVLVPGAMTITYVVEDARTIECGENKYVSIEEAVEASSGDTVEVTVTADVTEEISLDAGKTLAVTVADGVSSANVTVTPAQGTFIETQTSGTTTTYTAKQITVEMEEPETSGANAVEVKEIEENGVTNTVSVADAIADAIAKLTDSATIAVVSRTDNTDMLDVVDMITVSLTEIVQEVMDGNETFIRSAMFDVVPEFLSGQSLGEGQTLKFRLPVDAAATNLAAVVYHAGKQFGVYPVQTYNNEKFIEVESAEFSPYGYTLLDGETANPVAAIGTTGYATLAAAVEAASAGDTITLLTDVALDEAVDIAESITLDLNGNTISISAANQDGYAISVSDGTVTITGNGAIDAGDDIALDVLGGSVTIANGTFGVVGVDDGSLTITDGTFNGSLLTADGTTTINGGTFNDVVDVGGGSVTIYGGTFTAADNVLMVTDAAGALTVNGGTFTATQSGEGEPIVVYVEGGTASLTAGTFTGGTIATDAAETGTLTVSGGSFPAAVPEEYCAEGYIPAAQDPDTGLYTVKQGTYVAAVYDDIYELKGKYETLASAINAAQDGDTVELLADIENVSGTYTIYKSIVLDGAGHSITAAENTELRDVVAAWVGARVMFQIGDTSDDDVTFTDIVLDGGETHYYTYLIEAKHGTLTVEDVVLLHGAEADFSGEEGVGYGAGIHLNGADLVVAGDYFFADTGSYDETTGSRIAGTGIFPFTGILYDGGSIHFEDDVDANIGGDLLLVGMGPLNVEEFTANSDIEEILEEMNIPDGFIPYTLALNGTDSGMGFVGASPQPWNTIIDYGKQIMDVASEIGYEEMDKTETPVEVGLMTDTVLPETFTFEDANFTVNGNGNALSGTIEYTDNAGLIENIVMGTDDDPLILDMTGVSEPVEFGAGVAVTNVTIMMTAEQATQGTPIIIWDVENGVGEPENPKGVTVALVDEEGEPTGDNANLVWDDGLGVAYIGPCEARLTDADGGNPVYTSLLDAIAAATNGCTVTLMGNVSLTSRLFVNAGANPMFGGGNRYATTAEDKSLTLDLNGHDITSASNIALAGGSLAITGTGTISTSAAGFAPVEVRGTGDLASKRTLTIGSGVTLSGAEFGLNVFGSNDTQKNLIDVTVDGTVNGMLFVLGNLKNVENEINIVVNGTVDASAVTGTSEKVHTGIAVNGNANVVVNDGAAVTGESGIEARAGRVTVNGGTVTATASPYSIISNNDGTTTKGAAIAVAQHTTKLATSVTLNGGTLVGAKAIGVTDVNGDMSKVSVQAKQSFTENSSVPDGCYWAETATAGTYELTARKSVIGTTITFVAATYDGTAQSPSVTVATNGIAIAPSDGYTVSAVSETNAGDYPVTITGTGAWKDSTNVTFTIAKKAITVAADDKTMWAGQTPPELTATMTDAVAGDTIAYTLACAADGTTAGEFDITVALGDNPNYDVTATKGTLTVTTAVACISDGGATMNYYASLADAIAAVPTTGAETTITMIANETFAKEATLSIAGNKNIVLDLNGKTVSGSSDLSGANFYFLTVNTGCALTVRDTSEGAAGKISFASSVQNFNYERVTVKNIGGTLTLESGTIENTTGGGMAYAVNNAVNCGGSSTFVMTGGTISSVGGDGDLRIYNNAVATADCRNNVTISGGTLAGTGIFCDVYLGNIPANYTGENVSTTLNISGGTINGLLDFKIRHKYNNNFTITGGDFTNAKLRVRKYASEYKGDEPTEPMVTISGGKFAFVDAVSAFNTSSGWTTTSSWTSYEKPYAVSGGVFNLAVPAAACAEGYVPVANTDDETLAAYPHTVAAVIAKIGDTYYVTLQAALDAVKAANTVQSVIELLADATLDLTKNGNVLGGDAATKITINGNGKTLTFNQKEAWAQVNTANNAELVLNNVNLTNGIDFTPSGNPLYVYNHDISFNCKATLNNVTSAKALALWKDASLDTVTVAEAEDAYSIWIHTTADAVAIKDLTVNTAKGRGIKVDDSFVTQDHRTPTASTTVAVNGATFTTKDSKSAILVNSSYPTAITTAGTVDISGVPADTTNLVWVDEASADKFGLVKLNDAQTGIAPEKSTADYAASLSANGTWIDGYYKTLEPAVNAATSTDTLTLLKNNSETFAVAKELTITRNGFSAEGVTADATEGYVRNVTSETYHFFTGAVATVITIADNGDGTSTTNVVGYYATLADAVQAAPSGATVVLADDVSLDSTIVVAKDLTIDLNGNDIVATDARALWIKAGDVTITGEGEISANGAGLAATSSVIRVGDGAANANAAKLTVGEDVTVSSATCYGITTFGTNAGGIALDVYGTVAVTSSGKADAAISGNGNSGLAPVTTTIRDGAVVSATNGAGIYQPGAGTLTIEGGSVTGPTAVYVKSGTVNVTGGTLTATGEAADYAYAGDGLVSTGDALVIDTCGYPNGGPAASITGGTFVSANGQSVASYAKDGNFTALDGFIPGTVTVDGQDVPNPARFSDAHTDGLAAGYMLVKGEDGLYAVVQSCLIRWYVGETVVQTNVVAVGTTAADVEALAPVNVTPGNGSISTFTGWDPAIGPAEDDVDYVAQFESVEGGVQLGGLRFTSITVNGATVTATFTVTNAARGTGEGFFERYNVRVKRILNGPAEAKTATVTLGVDDKGAFDGTGVVEVILNGYESAFLIGFTSDEEEKQQVEPLDP